ncbi:cyclic lactone autoinducer peptide [Cohnella panacarvi]
MKNPGKVLVSVISKLLAVTAVMFVSTACAWIIHRPKVPSELQSKK